MIDYQKKKWQKIIRKPDIVIFEGWCIGAFSKKDLLVLLNKLEKEKDKKNLEK